MCNFYLNVASQSCPFNKFEFLAIKCDALTQMFSWFSYFIATTAIFIISQTDLSAWDNNLKGHILWENWLLDHARSKSCLALFDEEFKPLCLSEIWGVRRFLTDLVEFPIAKYFFMRLFAFLHCLFVMLWKKYIYFRRCLVWLHQWSELCW